MSRIQVYLYSNCSSCKNAEQVLKSAGVDYDRRDIFSERLTVEELRSLFGQIGRNPSELLSRRSNPYRQLDLAHRDLSESELVSLMALHPGLLRRPVVIAPDDVLIGFYRPALESLAQRWA